MPINHQDSYHWIPTEAFIFHWKTGVLTGSKKWPLSEFGTCWLGGLSHPSQNSKEEKTHVSVSEKKFERTKSPPRNASFLLETIDFYRGPKILKWRYIDHDISIPRVSCFFCLVVETRSIGSSKICLLRAKICRACGNKAELLGESQISHTQCQPWPWDVPLEFRING